MDYFPASDFSTTGYILAFCFPQADRLELKFLYLCKQTSDINYGGVCEIGFKGAVQPRIKNGIFFLLPVVRFINQDCFGVSGRVLEMSGVEMSVFSTVWWD